MARVPPARSYSRMNPRTDRATVLTPYRSASDSYACAAAYDIHGYMNGVTYSDEIFFFVTLRTVARMGERNVGARVCTKCSCDAYASHMTRLSGAVVNGCDDALDLSCRLTFLIHFNREPSQREARALRTMADALTHSLNHPFHSHISSAKRVLRDAVEQTTGGMTHRWIDAGMSREDAYVELAHNVVGMTLQWAYLIRRLSLSTDAMDTLEDAAHFVLDDLPAKVAASRVDGALVLHDLEQRCKGAQRPVTFQPPPRRSEHIVHDDQPIASETDTHYVPFGYGARRCPGEWLTYTMLRTLRVTSDGTSETATHMGLNMCPGGACDEGCDNTPPT